MDWLRMLQCRRARILQLTANWESFDPLKLRITALGAHWASSLFME